ncbi:hypothetical protein MTO96_051167 [Rhipicephalus appendiculatus]
MKEKNRSKLRRNHRGDQDVLLENLGGYYVGNEPRWKQWAQKKKKHRRIGQRVSQVPTSPTGKQNETGNQGTENIVPEAGTQQNGRETVGKGRCHIHVEQ